MNRSSSRPVLSVMFHSLGVLAALLAFSGPGVSAQAPPPGVSVSADLEYGRAGDRALTLDLYQPGTPAAQPRPAMVVIHGGGWKGGDKKEGALAALGFVARGYVAISVNYRLSGVATFPAAVEDCKCAVRWLRANASKHGVDPDRIGAIGFSAGGHLALMLACVGDTEGLEGTGGNPAVSSWVSAACSWFGPADFARGEMEFAEHVRPLLTEFLGGPFAQRPEPYRRASPITYASWDDAPVLLVHGDRDSIVPFDQSVRMHARLKEVGAAVEFWRVKHGEHGFVPKDAPATEPTFLQVTERTFAWFDRRMK